mmetsp:Transcript_91344/g.229621  ORF Transcript_91344/g.229621 Transcript_91344/m.229621 type:complete len:161 (-) Transcript_91344:779-1261(-)
MPAADAAVWLAAPLEDPRADLDSGAATNAKDNLVFPDKRRRASSIPGCGGGGGGTVFAGVSHKALADDGRREDEAAAEDDEAAPAAARPRGVRGVPPEPDGEEEPPLAAEALRLEPATFLELPAPSSSSSSSPSSKSMTNFVKHTGQPTPPDGSLGASAT